MWTQTNSTEGLRVIRCRLPNWRREISCGWIEAIAASPTAPPAQLHDDELGAEPGAMPAKVSVRVRARVTAGLAKLVELVNQ